jgi:menaquinone-9 beta-reductase
MTTLDVVVIGGGPAGCVAATHLARGGARVALVERLSVPHHKVCGEFLSGEGLPYLSEIGVDLSLATHIPRMRLHGPARSCDATLPLAGRGLSRIRLDEALLDAAAGAGVEVIRGEQVTTLDRVGADFRVGSHIANVVICATGKAEFMPVQPRTGRDSGMVGYKVHLRLSPAAQARLEGHVDLFVFRGGYGGLATIEGGLANLCFLLERGAIERHGRDWETVALELEGACEGLAACLNGSEPAFWPPAVVANIPYGFVREQAVADDIYCIGDQLAVIPSLTGEGMAIAMMSGRRAAEHILQGLGAAAFHKEMADILNPRVRLGFHIHRLFKSPRIVDLGTQLVRRWPRLLEYVFRNTRIPSTAMLTNA